LLPHQQPAGVPEHPGRQQHGPYLVWRHTGADRSALHPAVDGTAGARELRIPCPGPTPRGISSVSRRSPPTSTISGGRHLL